MVSFLLGKSKHVHKRRAFLLVRYRYSYGPVQLDAADGAAIDIIAVPSFSGSVVRIYKSGQLLSSGAAIALSDGTQSTILIHVYNLESGIELQYELIVIRPQPLCNNNQLTQW